MNIWRWLTTPDPSPTYTASKIGRIAARFVLFLLAVTLINTLLSLTPLRPYVATWWGSAIVVFALYIPFARILILDTPGAMRQQGLRGPAVKPSAAAVRRKERNRYAGVKKGPPGGGRGGGRR
ncbi:hypothetical protein [Deinococcus ruber]|uniref:Uncharacterized protein n=1 Tax=Deinococcus ruber TaxID=1848197 RepID=A0A918CGY4_9DEIO|nr:hypothetical protein [Deinococcus ruber]GGR21748.1 hypothetical protein GCM10008957_37530 [Deinococcus ruber]